MQNRSTGSGRATVFAAGLAAAVLWTSPILAADLSAAGLWQKTEDGKPVVWVLVLDRGNNVFEGAIAKMFPLPGEDPNAVCSKCVDDRKNQPVLGISFIRDMKRDGFVYENGNVLDPRDGKIWSAKMTLSPDGQALTLRGYVGYAIFGKNETWQRLPDSSISQLDASVAAKYLPPPVAPIRTPVAAKKSAAPAGAPVTSGSMTPGVPPARPPAPAR